MVHSDLIAQRGIKFVNEKPCVQNFYPGKSKVTCVCRRGLERRLHEYLNVKNMCLLPRGLCMRTVDVTSAMKNRCHRINFYLLRYMNVTKRKLVTKGPFTLSVSHDAGDSVLFENN